MSSTHHAERSADGLEAIFLAHRAALVGFVRARGGGDEAEDVVQDLWARIAERRTGPVADPVAYIFRMADNLMIDRLRTTMRRRRREDQWRGSYEESRTERVGQPHAERSVIARQRLEIVERRLAALGERTLTIFRRYRLDAVGQAQIAAELGISLSAVEKHLQKAYRVLLTIQREESAGFTSGQRLDTQGASNEDR